MFNSVKEIYFTFEKKNIFSEHSLKAAINDFSVLKWPNGPTWWLLVQFTTNICRGRPLLYEIKIQLAGETDGQHNFSWKLTEWEKQSINKCKFCLRWEIMHSQLGPFSSHWAPILWLAHPQLWEATRIIHASTVKSWDFYRGTTWIWFRKKANWSSLNWRSLSRAGSSFSWRRAARGRGCVGVKVATLQFWPSTTLCKMVYCDVNDLQEKWAWNGESFVLHHAKLKMASWVSFLLSCVGFFSVLRLIIKKAIITRVLQRTEEP